jgi:hypothetical protein
LTGLASWLAYSLFAGAGEALERFGSKRFCSKQRPCDTQTGAKAAGNLQKSTTLHRCSLVLTTSEDVNAKQPRRRTARLTN